MKNFLTEVIENKIYSTLKPLAERLMVDYYRSIKNFVDAIKATDNLLEKYKNDHDYVCDLLYVKGLMLAHDSNQSDKAVESFSLIIQQYPENSLSKLAENELRIIGQEIDKQTIGKGEITSNEIEIYNYPNPFNPTTTITFSLPKKDNVKLFVYDILGRELKKLADGIYEAGEHKIEFNASNLPSGVYFYRMEAGNFSQTKKLILTK